MILKRCILSQTPCIDMVSSCMIFNEFILLQSLFSYSTSRLATLIAILTVDQCTKGYDAHACYFMYGSLKKLQNTKH